MALKILIVDNNKKEMVALKEILSDNYCVVEFTDGNEALLFLKQNVFLASAIIIRVSKSDRSGFELLKKISSDKDLISIPMIAVGEKDISITELRNESNGIVDYVIDVNNSDVLKHCVSNIARLNEKTELVVEKLKTAKNNAHMQEVFDYISCGITATTFDEKNVDVIFINSKFCEIHGYTKEQYNSEVKNLLSLVCKDDLQYLKKTIKKVKKTRKSITAEYRIIRRDGKMAWIRALFSVHTMQMMKCPILFAVYMDISEEQKANERLKMLLNNIPGGIATYAGTLSDLQLIYFNDGFCNMFGYSHDEYEKIAKEGIMNLTFNEDVPKVIEQLKKMNEMDVSLDCVFRVHTKNGGYKWVNLKGTVSERNGDKCVLNSVIYDITERIEKENMLRISEERFRIAAKIGDRAVAHYDINTGVYYHNSKLLFKLGFSDTIQNMPDAFLNSNYILEECIESCANFYEGIKQGIKDSSVDFALKANNDNYIWFRNEATVICDDEGVPTQAIIVTTNITEQREKEAAFSKFQQSLLIRKPDSYTYFRWNLNKEMFDYRVEGSLLKVGFEPGNATFNERTKEYADICVWKDDREKYLEFVNSDRLLGDYHRGKSEKTMEYREGTNPDNLLWRRVSVELVEYPGSDDIEAYLMYEDIDEEKRRELHSIELAENDPLTGVLNRTSFIQKMNHLIKECPDEQHVLFMIDLDCFKNLNDSLGHAAGDQVLIDVTNSLRSILRKGDLLGRLGGDEFLVFMHGINYDGAIKKKAQTIGNMLRRTYNDIQVSASVGIAVYPNDGKNFYSLYRCADTALYRVKDDGKDSFAFFNRNMHIENVDNEKSYGLPENFKINNYSKRRMLVVDDNKINRDILVNLFSNDYIVDVVNDGSTALMSLRHLAKNTSIVLLDLLMPGIDGFFVLDKMRENPEMRSIPVIVVSGQDSQDVFLKAIKAGAVDFITKPIEPELIRVRVEAAISRAESERERTQNSYLLFQNSEEAKYRTVLKSTGTVVIEYDWIGNVFSYDSSISEHIAGRFDNRRLWQILLSDMIAVTADVKKMQELTHKVAENRKIKNDKTRVKLKTPSDKNEWFEMNVYKHADSLQLTSKLFITFLNINDEVISEQKLRFQVERDELTLLWNRETFFKKAKEMISERECGFYTIASFDVNRFKVINDQYGIGKGDEFLKHIADVFSEGFSEVGGIVSRITADNFAALYPTNFMNSNNMVSMYENAAKLDDFLPQVTFSIGRYIINDLSLSVAGMLDRANMAQETIKGRYDMQIALYDESMRDRLLDQQRIVNEMKQALNEKQFEIWFQPQYNHEREEHIGAEVLVRWRHPEFGIVSPNKFIPIFERNGFIYELDKFVWEQACLYLHRKLDSGANVLPVSVNISRYDLLRNDLYSTIINLILKYEIPVSLLRLEITESAFAENNEKLINVVNKLMNYGFVIEIDDFGSGYSSLNTLKDVPAQVLKLDMCFLNNKGNNERGGNILESVVLMAKNLGMTVIAEGVETKMQADYLKSIGCNDLQGYYYSKPMSAYEYDKFF